MQVRSIYRIGNLQPIRITFCSLLRWLHLHSQRGQCCLFGTITLSRHFVGLIWQRLDDTCTACPASHAWAWLGMLPACAAGMRARSRRTGWRIRNGCLRHQGRSSQPTAGACAALQSRRYDQGELKRCALLVDPSGFWQLQPAASHCLSQGETSGCSCTPTRSGRSPTPRRRTSTTRSRSASRPPAKSTRRRAWARCWRATAWCGI